MSPTPTKEEVEEQPKVEKENIISPTKKIETHSEESQVEKTIVPIKEEAIQKIPTASEAKIVQPVEEIKEEAKLEKELARVNGMLSNERFISKAPQAKIDEEKAKLEKYTQMMEQVKERLAGLRK